MKLYFELLNLTIKKNARIELLLNIALPCRILFMRIFQTNMFTPDDSHNTCYLACNLDTFYAKKCCDSELM